MFFFFKQNCLSTAVTHGTTLARVKRIFTHYIFGRIKSLLLSISFRTMYPCHKHNKKHYSAQFHSVDDQILFPRSVSRLLRTVFISRIALQVPLYTLVRSFSTASSTYHYGLRALGTLIVQIAIVSHFYCNQVVYKCRTSTAEKPFFRIPLVSFFTTKKGSH